MRLKRVKGRRGENRRGKNRREGGGGVREVKGGGRIERREKGKGGGGGMGEDLKGLLIGMLIIVVGIIWKGGRGKGRYRV